MATFSGSLNFAYFVDAPATPGTNETGMQPAVCSAIGYGASGALQSSPPAPGAPAVLASQAIGGAALPLTKEP